MSGVVEGLERHVLRLAQLLICICGGARQEEIGRRNPPGPETVRERRKRTVILKAFIVSVLSCVWSESVKSASKNVCGDDNVDGVDAGDVFRSRPEQILQIIRTWRRFREKEEGFFFLQAADSGDHQSK